LGKKIEAFALSPLPVELALGGRSREGISALFGLFSLLILREPWEPPEEDDFRTNDRMAFNGGESTQIFMEEVVTVGGRAVRLGGGEIDILLGLWFVCVFGVG